MKPVLSGVIGFLVGAAGALALVTPRFNAALDQDKQAVQSLKNDNERLTTALNNSTVYIGKTIAASGGVTLLYDPAAQQSLQSTGQSVQTFPGNSATPYQGFPRWIVAGKIKPLITGGPTRDATYSYYDPSTKTYEGPFFPEIPQQRP